MKIKVQLLIESDEGVTQSFHEVARLERGEFSPETLGLTLAEARSILAGVQEKMVEEQAADFIAKKESCSACGESLALKDTHSLAYRTPFGKLSLRSPRFYRCRCRTGDKESFSPLAQALEERTSPELFYLETKWAAVVSYGMTTDLLGDVLPIGQDLKPEGIRRNVHKVARRMESELGDERVFFIEGCEAQWQRLPEPPPPLTVGIDGGYVHSRDWTKRSENVFEVIVGKSLPTEGRPKCFGFVLTHDPKPKRRVYEALCSQGFQMNQAIRFICDGEEILWRLQEYLTLNGEHILDWFHITMRLTVMDQMAKGLPAEGKKAPADSEDPSAEEFVLTRAEAQHLVKRIKWNLWHGNVYRALEQIEFLEMDLECMEDHSAPAKKMYKWVHEFGIYISRNRDFIPNYGDLWRNGERISTGFVESTVNQVIGKRFNKRQQMRWTKEGAHLLLQVRTKVLNGDWRSTFERWYPGLRVSEAAEQKLAA